MTIADLTGQPDIERPIDLSDTPERDSPRPAPTPEHPPDDPGVPPDDGTGIPASDNTLVG